MPVTPARPQLYDQIGLAYSATRRTDPRIAARIWAALGDARTVVNVGAGTGSYEPPDRDVTAVEPSAVMRSQRLPGAAIYTWRRQMTSWSKPSVPPVSVRPTPGT